MNRTGRQLRTGVLLIAFALPSAFGATSLSQFGITWYFNTDHPSGQYANGDWWVVGPVTITNITPASIDNGTGRIINGSQLNPPVSGVQGYDSAPGDMTYSAALNAGRPGGNALSAENPLVITNGSLISSVSVTALQPRPQVKTAAILTVVESAPEEGAFRPPPVGSDKTSYWNKTNLNYSILKSLIPPTNMPVLATVTAKFEKPWLEQNPGWTARYIHPQDNQPVYGRDMAHLLAQGLLSLHMNYTPAQKEPLFIRLVQYGIDIYGTAREGGMWEDLGGHNQGRKMPMLLAGMALNDTNILLYADASRKFIFHEDRQTWYVTQSDVGRVLYTADGRPREQYIQEDVGIAEWGEQHTRQPVRDGRNWDSYYRNNNYASSMGNALAARLTPGAVSLWNWPAFFDYMDRAFAIEGANASSSVDSIQPYVANIWRMYRDLADADGDGLLDSWETQYFGGATNANSSATAANGLNTIYETYIAGLNPTNPASIFLISDFRSPASGNILQWNATSGRVYSIYGSTNLLNGFQPLATNIVWPQNSWTNPLQPDEGFYRLKVRLKD